MHWLMNIPSIIVIIPSKYMILDYEIIDDPHNDYNKTGYQSQWDNFSKIIEDLHYNTHIHHHSYNTRVAFSSIKHLKENGPKWLPLSITTY